MSVDLLGLKQESEDELFRAYAKLFPYRLSSVIRRGENGRWFEISRFHYLTDMEILEALQSRSNLERGFRSEDESAFLVIRIPAESQYHSSQVIAELREKLKELQVEPCHFQIDRDWYLYIFLNRFAEHLELNSALAKWLEQQGYALKEGELELYPADKAIPFPLQGNFTWLNEKCQLLVRRGELSLKDALGFFLDQVTKTMLCPQELLRKIISCCGVSLDESEPAGDDCAEKQASETLLAEMLETADLATCTESAEFANVLALPVAGRDFNAQGIEAEALLFPELDIFEGDSGSRLVIFEDSPPVEEPVKPKEPVKKKKQEDSQLLLFPVQEQSRAVTEKKAPKASESGKRKIRRNRGKQKRKGQG